MAKGPRVGNDELLNAGLRLMERNGKPLKEIPSRGKTKIFELPNGETVRARTCNDHILIVVADKPSSDAKLNIEGTDWILLTMPREPRTPGPVDVYLLPTEVAVKEARCSHADWLATNPNTKGENTTWNLWFDGDGNKSNRYAEKWAQYRLPGEASTDETQEGKTDLSSAPTAPTALRDEINAARERIAQVAGVSPDAVKVTIDFL